MREAKLAHRVLDPHGLFVSQTDLINDVNKELEPSVFNNFVPNYKSLANIHKMFSTNVSPKNSVILEELVLEHMSRNEEAEEQVEIDNVVVESFVEKFNTKYDNKLLTEQKQLLNLYISSFVDNSLELKMFLNEEIARLKSSLLESRSQEEIVSDESMVEKTEQVLELLENYKDTEADQNMLLTILKVQQLVGEIENNASSN
jgi:benzoyl-CoA reductase/2-hydroxyglutaryl-CoA dehydratase subunit BcrC/BadD/HgdB